MTKFRINVIVRVFLTLAFGFSAFVIIVETPFWPLGCWLVLFTIVTTINLIYYVEKSERELSDFLMAIKQHDFTTNYSITKPSEKKLHQAFNIITREFVAIRGEKESNYHFLKTVVEHSGVPLIAYNQDKEQLILANKAVKDLFHLPHFTKLSSLSRISPELVAKIRELATDEKVLIKVTINDESLYLSITVKELVLQSRLLKVVAFHNINAELEQQEVESWQKLIRVLTHEIKNSVIPISTLAEVINDMFKDLEEANQSIRDMGEEDIDDLALSIKTIEKRSKGLVKFVTSYGNLAKVPKPKFEKCELTNLVRGIVQLEDAFLKKNKIKVTTNLPTSQFLVNIDQEMIEQVVINLIKNAVEAIIESRIPDGHIVVSLVKNPHLLSLEISDNGPGIDQETLDNIFVPFFTTKKEGSGIGLSLSKQIMRAHRGNIKVRSEVGNGTTFELTFR
ncbi:MAG: ATP-binding protein [Cyclobacteriaceae bacterium]